MRMCKWCGVDGPNSDFVSDGEGGYSHHDSAQCFSHFRDRVSKVEARVAKLEGTKPRKPESLAQIGYEKWFHAYWDTCDVNVRREWEEMIAAVIAAAREREGW